MVNAKKEQERQELFSNIWKIADELRGAVDGWDFKAYVIGALFYRFLSENLAEYVNENERLAGNADFDYATLDDAAVPENARKEFVNISGYFIAPSQLFCNVLRDAKTNPSELNVKLDAALRAIEDSSRGAESERDFNGLFRDFAVDSSKLGASHDDCCKKLLNVLLAVDSMKLKSSDNEIDVFGDAYEYLMGMYASHAGKSGGEFFTPQEVSELLAEIAVDGKKNVNAVYDPACGSGSLLLKAWKRLGRNISDGIYGQEINQTTYNMCRINMILHGVEYNKFDIACGDTLRNPYAGHRIRRENDNDRDFDVIVSNPPYSTKWEGKDDPTLINDPRFAPAGVLAPSSKADLAFVMHCLHYLSPKGTAAIVCFPGVMYRGGAEKQIRRYLVEAANAVDCVIQLPSNLFYGTSIATCVLVMKKNRSDESTLFIDASREFVKVTNNNKLTPENIKKIADAVLERKDVEYFARLVPRTEIAENDYNLSVSTYVEQRDTREKIDIVKLNAEIKEIVAREQVLRDAIDKIVAEIEA